VTPEAAAANVAQWLRRLGLSATVEGATVHCSDPHGWPFAVGEAADCGELDVGGLQLVVWDAETVRILDQVGVPLRFYDRDHAASFWQQLQHDTTCEGSVGGCSSP
jgi:hypothetical protein